MMARWLNAPTVTWLALMTITVVSVSVGEARTFGRLAPILISLAALVKGVLVVCDFMEIRGGESIWLRLYVAWLIAAACLLLSTGL